VQIDGFRFAEHGEKQQGVLPLASFTRLRDVLRDTEGGVQFCLTGTRESQGRLALRLQLDTALQLTCQRCLEPMRLPVHTDVMLILARTEAEVEAGGDDPESPDRVLASSAMSVDGLIEDELLLLVPFAPRHAAQCVLPDRVHHAMPSEDTTGSLGKLRHLLTSTDSRKPN
jgi:uncharacterized protein